MKKKMVFLLIFMFFCPITIFAQDKVSVKSIVRVEGGDPVEELSDPYADDLNINVNVKFNEVGESIKYKVEVENKDNEDYQLNMGKEFGTSEYIKYSYSYEDNSSILKANTTKVMYVTISYEKEVPDTELKSDGTYEEENNMKIGVSRDEDNPKTGRDELIVITVVLGLVILLGFIMINNRQAKYMVLALGILLLIPTVSAIKHITITMNTKIKIERELEFCFFNYDPFNNHRYLEENVEREIEYRTYLSGETVRHYDVRTGENLDSFAFIDNDYAQCVIDNRDKHNDYVDEDSWYGTVEECKNHVTSINGSEKIIHKSKGCYAVTPR